MSEHGNSPADLGEPIEHGEWAGWAKWTGAEPFEDLIGPFYTKRNDNGALMCGARVQSKNLRSGGICHGGLLMSFADYSLFLLAYDEIGNQNGVTVSLTTEFLAAAPANSLLIATGDVLRKGRNLMFSRGVVTADNTPVLAFTGVVKLLS